MSNQAHQALISVITNESEEEFGEKAAVLSEAERRAVFYILDECTARLHRAALNEGAEQMQRGLELEQIAMRNLASKT